MDMGIYEIKNTKTNKRYVGSSSQLNKRKIRHFSSLRNNRHENRYIQEDWNIYGEKHFVFNVLESVDDSKDLLIREGYWMNKLKSDDRMYGYNIYGFDSDGNVVVPKEVINQIIKNTNHLEGIHHPNSKLTNEAVVDITTRVDKGENVLKLADEYQIDKSTVYQIANNEVWKSVKRKTAKKHRHDRKLTEIDVREIKIALSQNASSRKLADKYCVHLDTIQAIKQGINWGYILPELDLSNCNNRLTPKRNKLNENQVKEIKRLLRESIAVKNIAEQFNVSTNSIYAIKNGDSWTDVVI